MSTSVLPDNTETPIAAAPTRRTVWRRFLRNPQALISAIGLLLIIGAVIAAPLLTGASPTGGSITDAFGPARAGHPLGFDAAGRDVWARLLYGGRASLGGAVIALVVALAVGAIAGLIAGYYRGYLDQIANWVFNLLMSLPAMVVLLASRAVVGPSTWVLMFVLGILAAPAYFRLVSGIVSAVSGELYVDAAKVSGLPDWRIMGRHILAVVRGPVLVQTALVAGIAIGLQAALEFLGIGSGEAFSWGGMLNDAFQVIGQQPHLIVAPALALGLTNAFLVLLASALRDVLEQDNAVPTKPSKKAVPPATVTGEPQEPTGDQVSERGALLSIRGLRVAYGEGTQEVVHGIDLDIAAGEVLGLVGESGSGKSQTAFSILDILPRGGVVTGGSLMVEGQEITAISRSARRALCGRVLGYIPQEPMSNLDPAFTIGAQLIEPVQQVLGLSRSQSRERAKELLAAVEIHDPERVMKLYPHQISGGMAQRVLIAGAISCDPKLLIADEPTTALDVTVQAEVLALLRRLQKDRDMGVLLVTHNLGVVADIADNVAVMRRGRIIEYGGVRDILTNPQDPYTQKLLDAVLDDAPTRPAWQPGTKQVDHLAEPLPGAVT
ncbi:dipeptide/oligopeptide/nickel ABC transporter permease/ATP-binding protein [Branchiibius cervicis]|uniref:Dipeptide/oligopeptide/nickel ABC transporter permease/ATP-binding protein n=1 Tax=Branchiibius cervicis TaxID=908252 RepID=A0ABW2AWK8_9MICO